MPRAGLSTESVVDAAVELVDEQGWPALTLAAVAIRTGVAAPSLYKHVRSLEALQQKVSARATAELAQTLSTSVAGRSGRKHCVASPMPTGTTRWPIPAATR